MTNNAEAIRTYQFKSSDELLLDTNIWIFLYGPQKPGSAQVAHYSKGFQNILAAQSRIYIDVLLVSEFINTYAKLKWNIFKKNNPARKNETFKVFRNSSDFKPIAQEIADAVKRISSHCIQVESGFESINLTALVNKYALGKCDFNDQVFASLCQNKDLKLITDDGDFKDYGVHIITANNRLLH
jgi:predicted nucleic acid-binding protein